MDYFIKHKFAILGGVIGAVGGYLYYHYVGCASGSCPITSNPLISTLYGSMLGGLLLNNLKTEREK